MSKLVGKLFNGPIDIIGDIHGEIDSLCQLLRHLEYDEHGFHQDGRRIIFLGDLVDRGPNSPAVVESVCQLVKDGRAQCILGNHELNILRNKHKDGNGWFMSPKEKGNYPFTPVTARQNQDFRSFFMHLPLALERDDLRVVHACWQQGSITKLAELDDSFHALDAYNHFEDELLKTITPFKKTPEIRALLTDKPTEPAFMEGLARHDSEYQMENPVRVLSSGEEVPAQAPFWAGGKWRMVKRVKWWDYYNDPIPVVIGHYWRYASKDVLGLSEKHGPDLFENIEPHHWMGARNNVYCVDFSVGLKHKARAKNLSPESCKLAALRWPERQLMDEEGSSFSIYIRVPITSRTYVTSS